MMELDGKDTPEVTGGIVDPHQVPTPMVRMPLPAPPEYPQNPAGEPSPVPIERYLT
jgi:hypothetical protein